MRNLYSNAVKLKKLSPEQTEKHLSRMIPTTEYSQLKRCDVVIEAVFENLELKKQIFNELDKICPPHTILTSNTSSLDIDQLAAATNRADKVMGTHFFIPVYQSKLLENSYGRSTSPQTVATVMKLGQKIGKFPVLMKNCELFVANRALIQYMWEATLLLEEGADPSSVDTAVEEFGIPMGPFRLNDIIGHDTFDRITTESILKYGFSENGRFVNNTPYSAIHKETFNSGRLGVKVGKGWYEYEKGSRDGFIDEDVLEILDRFRAEHNVQPRIHSKQEIIERCTLSMVHECFRILQDGIISCPDDIDFICVTALGWPKTTGGPLFYASRTGLNNLLAKMKHYRTSLTDALQWTPCELLVELAAQDVPYAEWMSFLEKSSKL
ncbi:peroxisomal bifunctional enzyme-like isoform X2 [Tubulanus polymorphus]